ncbi:MAG: CvpA family protein [Kouleothrix sp.]
MNVTDIVFILILLGGLALGFFQGTIRLIITIIAFYVGIVLASLYFQSAR